MDPIVIKGIFRFLDLPIEIRNDIYRFLLNGNYISRRVPNLDYESSKTESEPIGNRPEPQVAAVGTLRCHNVWRETQEYCTEILRVNKQVHEEAAAIFLNENNWITVNVNKSGFGAEMKRRGFGVLYCGNLDHIEYPILKVSINFPSLRSRRETDTFLMSVALLNRLPRALWTTVGMREMEIRLELHPIFASISQEKEDNVLYCFYRLRGVRKAILVGGNQEKHKTMIPIELTTPHVDANDILQDLKVMVGIFNAGWKRGQRQEIADLAEITIAFLSDCYKVYGTEFISTNDQAFHDICSATIRLAEGIAEARMDLGQYHSVIKYSNYAMKILPISPKRRANLLVLQGEAQGALGKDTKLIRNLLEAQQLIPDDGSVMTKLSMLKKRLDPDPSEALAKFKELRVVAAQEVEAERKIFNRQLKGKIVFRMLPNGGLVVEDHRSDS